MTIIISYRLILGLLTPSLLMVDINSALAGDIVSLPAWQKVTLEFDHLGDGKALRATLLRPVEWMAATGADVGRTVHLQFDEMGIDGWARVVAIESAAAPRPDIDGNIITGTFVSSSNDIIELGFAAPNEFTGRAFPAVTVSEPQTVYYKLRIQCTTNHLLYSKTRGQWVKAEDIQIGELIQTQEGVVVLISRHILPGSHRVYNLEVDQDHSYFVSRDRLLAHNGCPNDDSGIFHLKEPSPNRYTFRGTWPGPEPFPIKYLHQEIIAEDIPVTTFRSAMYDIETRTFHFADSPEIRRVLQQYRSDLHMAHKAGHPLLHNRFFKVDVHFTEGKIEHIAFNGFNRLDTKKVLKGLPYDQRLDIYKMYRGVMDDIAPLMNEEESLWRAMTIYDLKKVFLKLKD